VVNRASISKQISNPGGRKKMAERKTKGKRKTRAAMALFDAARKTQVADKPNKVVTLSPDPKVKDKVPMSRTQRRLKKAVTAAKKEDAARAAARAEKKAAKEAASKAADTKRKKKFAKGAAIVGTGTALTTAALLGGKGKETTPRGSEFKSKTTKSTPKGSDFTKGSNFKSKATSYSIKSGDTLSQIAKKQGTTLKALLAANPNIKDANKIRVGQKIKLGSPVKNRKSVYQGMTQKQMADMAMPKKRSGTVKRMGGGKVMSGSQLVASLYD